MKKLLSSVADFLADQSGFLRLTYDQTPSGGMAPNATFSIVQEAGDPITVAPHPQWFTVGSLSGFTPPGPASGAEVIDPSAHDITWVWDFGDPTSEPHPSCNLPDAWRDTNIAYGKRVCHVFDGPGTYTVTCWAFDNDGHYGVATTTITVADPATFFPGNRTICVNPVGDTDFSLAIPGAQQIVGLANARDAAVAAGATSRILLKRGATFNGELPTAWAASNPNAYVAGNVYGTGADARIIAPAEFDGSLFNYHGVAGVACNRYIGIDYEGNWDVVSETGWNAQPFNFIAGSQIGPFMLHKCRLRNSNGHSIGTDPTYHVVISSCLIENWRAFALIPSGSGGAGANDRLAVIGTAMHMSVDAGQGLEQSFFTHQLGNFNGPVRYGYIRNIHFSACSVFSNTGWSRDDGGLNVGQVSRQSIQSSIRGNSDPVEAYNASLPTLQNFERCVLEGNGVDVCNTQSARPGNHIYDKIIFIGNSDSNRGHLYMTGGTTVRNCLFYQPNTRMARGVALGFTFNGVNVAGVPEAASRRVRVYNNTFYSAQTSANRVWFDPGSGRDNIALFEAPAGWVTFTDLVAENNIVHAPVQNSTLVTAAPVSLLAIPGVQTFYRGARWSFRPPEVTLASNVGPGQSFTLPYPDDSMTAVDTTRRHYLGQVTNQAYFLTPPGLNRHMMGFSGDGRPKNLKSWGTSPQFTVTFGASNITITNNTATTWQAGWVAAIHFDRRNSNNTRQTVGFTSPATIEVPTPIAGSPALSNLTSGARAWDDFYTNVRVGQINRVGLTVSGNTSLGARDPVAG